MRGLGWNSLVEGSEEPFIVSVVLVPFDHGNGKIPCCFVLLGLLDQEDSQDAPLINIQYMVVKKEVTRLIVSVEVALSSS